MKGSLIVKSAVLMTTALAASGCFGRTVSLRESDVAPKTSSRAAVDARGTTEVVWEEPMVDSVDVPPGLDPEGHYYRPGHQEIVEIRQGRWKPYKGSGE